MELARPEAAGEDADAWAAPLPQGRAGSVSVQSAVTERRMSQGSPAIRRVVQSAAQ